MFQPTFSRILKEDLGPDAPKWVDRLLYQLNLITDYLKIGFNRAITIQDNLINPFSIQQIKATGVPATDTISFQANLPAGYQPKGVIVVNCIDLGGTVIGNPVWAEMTPGLQNGDIVVRAIYGLTAGHTYQITFLLF